MKKVPSMIVKQRSRELTTAFESFTPYDGMEGRVERIWMTEIATDGIHLVGHTKGYVQVLVVGPESILGTSAVVKITSVGRWSVFGEVIKTLDQINAGRGSFKSQSSPGDCSPSSNLDKTCACPGESEPCVCPGESKPFACPGESKHCACEMQCVVEPFTSKESIPLRNDMQPEHRNDQNLIRWFLRKRKNNGQKRVQNEAASGSKGRQELVQGSMSRWDLVDRALLVGMLVSFLTIVALILHLSFRIFSSN